MEVERELERLWRKVQGYLITGNRKGLLSLNFKETTIVSKVLEKQISSTPYSQSDGYADDLPVWDYYCPDCSEEFNEERPNFCPNCGKKINWREIEEKERY